VASNYALGEFLFALGRIPGALKRRSEVRRHRKLMKRAPRFSLAEMPENTFGKVVGIARPEQKRLLEAPLSGRLCVYYETYIDAMYNGSLVRTLASEQEGLAFVLEDEGGARALVDPANAYMSTGIDHISQSTLYIGSDREMALQKRNDVTAAKLGMFVDGYRYREAIIEAEERIAVFGGGVREPDPAGRSESYRGHGVPTRLCLSGSDRFPLFISDDPKSL
jgi:hypothetical protein